MTKIISPPHIPRTLGMNRRNWRYRGLLDADPGVEIELEAGGNLETEASVALRTERST